MAFQKCCVTSGFVCSQGKKNPGTDNNSVLSFLDQVMKAKEMEIDRSCSSQGPSIFMLKC